MTYMLVAMLVVALAGAVGAAYYRSRALRAEDALKLMKDIGAQWRASNAQLQDRVRRAEEALVERQTKEAAEDADAQKRASGDADLAVDLLNQLHSGGPSGGPSAGADVQPGADPGVPGDQGRKVHRR